MLIHTLPAELISKIVPGEVIKRPIYVVFHLKSFINNSVLKCWFDSPPCYNIPCRGGGVRSKYQVPGLRKTGGVRLSPQGHFHPACGSAFTSL